MSGDPESGASEPELFGKRLEPGLVQSQVMLAACMLLLERNGGNLRITREEFFRLERDYQGAGIRVVDGDDIEVGLIPREPSRSEIDAAEPGKAN